VNNVSVSISTDSRAMRSALRLDVVDDMSLIPTISPAITAEPSGSDTLINRRNIHDKNRLFVIHLARSILKDASNILGAAINLRYLIILNVTF
jgi:hypothetical protein